MHVFGVMVVRNEADILRVNLAHHFALGIDRFLIADNGSSDGTDHVLEKLSRGGRVLWTKAEGPFLQSEIASAIAREAFLRGADWVVPVDADEFWWAPSEDFRDVLEGSPAGALEVEVVNFIQKREQLERAPQGLLEMTRRTARPIGPIDRAEELVEERQIAFVEILYPPKHISRASFALEIGQGNHSVTGVAGSRDRTDRILCLHAPLRARAVLEAKVDGERPAEDLERYLRLAWHVRRWRRLAEKKMLEQEWRANSYERESLDVYGHRHPVVFDSRLRDVVAPWIHRKKSEVDGEPGVRMPLEPPLPAHLSAARPDRVKPVVDRMTRIDGWLSESEAAVLIATAALALSSEVPHAVVEVGSYCGRSTVVLGSVVKYISPASGVYAIDPHEGEVTMPDGETRLDAPTLDTFRRNIAEAGLDGVVHGIRKRSFEVKWATPISFLFIDGLHDYGNVSRDFAHFERWVVPGGYVVFDDYDGSFPGVVALVDELLKSDDYRKVLTAGKLIVTQKSNASGGTKSSPSEQPRTSEGSEQWLTERLQRQERGIEFLRDVLSEETGRRASEVATRDRMIQDLQAELHAKVGECNRVIRELQAELHGKVGECNRIIQELQSQLRRVGADLTEGKSGSGR